MIVPMDCGEVHLAHTIGLMRQQMNANSSDKSYYKASRMEANRIAQPAAVLCELAVAKALNVYVIPKVWPASKHSIHKQEGDIGELIEVRRVRQEGIGPAVRSTDRGRAVFGCYIIDNEWTSVDVLGFYFVPRHWRQENFDHSFIRDDKSEQPFWRVPLNALTEPTKENFNSAARIFSTHCLTDGTGGG